MDKVQLNALPQKWLQRTPAMAAISNLKSRRLWCDFESIFHEREKVIPGFKDHVTCQGAQVVEKGFSGIQGSS